MNAASDAQRLVAFFSAAVVRAARAGRPTTELETLQRCHEVALRLWVHYGDLDAGE